MAIYHFSAKVISRSDGRSAVAAAAYRAAAALEDLRTVRRYDYTAKQGVVHSAILLPDSASARLLDQSTLWNEVEAMERRRDAQLARDIELSLPRELSQAAAIQLAHDFVAEQFVARGMVADLNVHWGRTKEGEDQPHVHVMLTMRSIGPDGFGPKVREWNATSLLVDWRERWATLANERLSLQGHDVRIDHRSNAAQGIGLEPQNKIGPACQYRLNAPQKRRSKIPHFVTVQSRPYPRGGLMSAMSDRSRSTMAWSASAVSVSRRASGRASAQAV